MSVVAFPHRPEPALLRSFALAALVHLVLLGVMFFGVNWQSHAPETVVVELWEVAPPPPPRVVETPKPPPAPPKVEPEPAPKKADIVEKTVEKPKPKPVPKVARKPRTVAKPKADPEFEKRLREQVAMEQKALDADRSQRELRDLLDRQRAAANSKALSEYIDRISRRVKSSWILPADLKGNPQSIFSVVQLPSGEVLSVRVLRSSGIASFDAAVERAILKSSPLPLPASREIFSRELKLTFRPQDK